MVPSASSEIDILEDDSIDKSCGSSAKDCSTGRSIHHGRAARLIFRCCVNPVSFFFVLSPILVFTMVCTFESGAMVDGLVVELAAKSLNCDVDR